ncbi:zinc-dependent metalloprotease [Longispora albida]|uniref:zinc-dependent metalloprotease n=1 Tax=Longispora albida TaxID=203523 RepID=UPI000369CF7C|nr:zinc-dependent metalloprotease [Longispora albida]
MTQFVDWELAAATAARLGGSGPRVTYTEAAETVTELRRLADEAAGHVEEFTGLRCPPDLPPIRVVDRADWAQANIDGLKNLFGTLVPRMVNQEPGLLTSLVGSKLTGAQAGTVLAFLSGKVLGQYEVFSGAPGQLLLVAPNITEVQQQLGADPRDFRLWVCLHEVAHRVQFTAVPWMRGHFLGEIQAFADASQGDTEAFGERMRKAFSALSDDSVNLLDAVQTPEQKKVVARLTALMTLLEGHAEFVMDGVGPQVVPSVEEIRAKFTARRSAANPIEKFIRRLLGIDAKLKQYTEGRKFVSAVVGEVGMAGFNKVFESPLTLPRTEELADPAAWIARVQ